MPLSYCRLRTVGCASFLEHIISILIFLVNVVVFSNVSFLLKQLDTGNRDEVNLDSTVKVQPYSLHCVSIFLVLVQFINRLLLAFGVHTFVYYLISFHRICCTTLMCQTEAMCFENINKKNGHVLLPSSMSSGHRDVGYFMCSIMPQNVHIQQTSVSVA